MTAAERLEQIRSHLGLTQAEMCARMGVALRTYAHYAGGRAPSAEALEAIGRMGFNIYWLLTGEEEMRTPQAAPEGAPAPVDEDLYGKVTEAVSVAYKECGYTATLRQVAARAARIAAGITAAGGTPDQQEYGLRLAVDQLRRDLRAAIANPTGDLAGGQKA